MESLELKTEKHCLTFSVARQRAAIQKTDICDPSGVFRMHWDTQNFVLLDGKCERILFVGWSGQSQRRSHYRNYTVSENQQ